VGSNGPSHDADDEKPLIPMAEEVGWFSRVEIFIIPVVTRGEIIL
jgi:hypothetical protein